jgi:hypothetical protein
MPEIAHVADRARFQQPDLSNVRFGWWAQPIAATHAAQYAQSPIGVITSGNRFTCYWAE